MSVGIDFGTLLNKIGCFNHTGFKIIANDYRNPATPSVAFLNHKDHWFFGEQGVKLGLNKPNQCIRESKMMLGRKFSDELVQSNLNYWKFKTIKGKKEDVQIEISVDDKSENVFPYEIVGKILQNLIEISKSRLPKPIHQTIISIPATFDKNQKNDLIKAAKLANLQNAHYVIEPILTSIAYLYNGNLNPSEKRNILIYSFGFSNPETSIIQIHDETYEITTKKDINLNGRQFDDNIFKYINEEMKKKYPNKINFIEQQKTQSKLRVACEEAKTCLSENDSTKVVLKDDEKDDDEEEEEEEENDLFVTLSYDKFNEINKELFDHSMDSVKTVIEEAKIGLENIDFLFLVGGMTKMRKIREKLKEITGKEPRTFTDPCEAPTLGACILGAHLLMKESPEIMFQRNPHFFDNLKIFENAFSEENLDVKTDSSDDDDDDDENLPLTSKSNNNESLNDSNKSTKMNENLNDENKSIEIDDFHKLSESKIENGNVDANESSINNENNNNPVNENIEELNSSLILIKEEVERLTKTLDNITDEIEKTNELNEETDANNKAAWTEGDESIKTLEFFNSVKEQPVDLIENPVKESDNDEVFNKSADFEKQNENEKEVENQPETVYYVTPIRDPDYYKDKENDKEKEKEREVENQPETVYYVTPIRDPDYYKENENDENDQYEEEEDSYDYDDDDDDDDKQADFDKPSKKVEFNVSSEKVEYDVSSEKVEYDVSSEKVEYDVSSEKVEYDVSSEKVEYDVSSEKVEFDVSSGKIDNISSSAQSVNLPNEREQSTETSGLLIALDENTNRENIDIIPLNDEEIDHEQEELIEKQEIEHLQKIIEDLHHNVPGLSKDQNQRNKTKSKVVSVVNSIVDYFDYVIIGASCVAIGYFACHMF